MSATADSIRALAKNPPNDPKARQEIYDAARELMFAVEIPADTDNRLYFAYAPLSITNIVSELKIFNTLADNTSKEWRVNELAEGCRADALLLHRLLRYLAALGLVTEVSEGTYGASHITPHLATPGFVAGLKHNSMFVNTSYAALPEYLAETKYQNPSNSKSTALNKALNTDLDIMQYLQAHPEKAAYAFQYMATWKATSPTWMDGRISVEDFKLSTQDLSDNRPMLVDVGGGSGHQCIDFRTAFPDLKGKMIVQDVPMMINMVDRNQAQALNIEPMAHDFYTPQPVRGAKVYYLRTVLHDWTDDACKTILRHLRDAMVEDSVVVVDESVIPKTGASLQQMHYDLTMMACLSALERTETQWRELFEAAGLRLRDIWIYDEKLQAGLIVGAPA